MNSSPQQILIVEIKTIEGDSIEISQLQKMTVVRDSKRRYHLAVGIEQVKSAILEAIPRLESNYRHPLYFEVQVIPGDRSDAIIASAENLLNRRKRSRKD